MSRSRKAVKQYPDSTAIPEHVTNIHKPVADMQDQLLFEKLLSAVSTRFIKIPLNLNDDEIHAGMREALDYFKADRITLLETSPDKQKWIITHFVSVNGVPSLPVGVGMPISVFPWLYERAIIKGDSISLEKIEDVPHVAQADRRSLAEWGIRSLLLVPVLIRDSIDHAISLSFTRREFKWPESFITRLRMLGEVFVNAIERKKGREKLEEQLRFEELLAEISTRFINLPADQVDAAIQDSQRLICEYLGLELSSLWQWSNELPRIVKMTHIYRPQGGPPLPEPMYAHEYFPWCQNEVESGRTINIPSLDEAPPEASVDKETWLYVGSKSVLTIPLVPGGGPIIGALSFNSLSKEIIWPELLVRQLKLLAQVFTNALSRKQMEAEVQKNEERLNITLEAVGASLWIMDINSKKVWVTQKSRELFHFAPNEEIYYESYIRLIHPEDRDLVEQVVKQAIESQKEFRCEYRIITPGGTVRWISSRGRWVDSSPGEPESLIGLSLDITERKGLELKLKDSEEEYRKLFENMHSGFIVVEVIYDPYGEPVDHRLLQANSEFEAQTGLKRDEEVGKTSGELSFKWPDNVRQQYYSIATTGGTLAWERYNESLGRYYDIRVFSPRRGLFGMLFNDITERKLAELELQKSEERLRLVMEANSEGIWDWNIPSGVAYFSPRYSSMLGYKPEEFAKDYEAWKELVHPDDFDRVHQAHGEHINEGKDFCVEFRMRKKTGDWCWILSRGMVIERDASGNAVRMVGTHLDISNRKEMEAEVKRSHVSLDTLINSTPDMIWSVDPERFGLMTFNSSLHDYFLHSVGLQITAGMSPRELFPSSDEFQDKWNSLYKKALNEGSYTVEYGPTFRAGRTLRLNFNILKLGETVFGISVFAQDITAIKEMEDKLREQLEEIKKLQCKLEKENIYLRQEIKAEAGFGKIISGSESMEYVLFRSRQVAPTDATVIILGETGVGKGMIANAIHENSGRKDRVMVTVNCAALPGNLIESELFGREKGAFTGAHARQAGRFEVADRGTIFLDEIGELPLELQAKLLRVLQDGEFERLGNPRSLKVDVRVIASTSRDLKQEVRNGRFREDLFYRLNTFPVTIPPLRKRIDDIPELARHFIDKYGRKFGRKFDSMRKDTMQRLQRYDWPGNVRELEHIIERSVITSTEPVFEISDRLENEQVRSGDDTSQGFETMAREHILRVLQKTGWKIDGQGGAAALLAIKPSTLRFRIKKLGLKRP